MRDITTVGDISLFGRVLRKARTEFARMTVRRPCAWTSGRRVVSFTFDDFPQSAARTGAAILESYGARGTYYASFGISGTESPSGTLSTFDEIAELSRRGHEIGCHTFSHLDCSLTKPARINGDCHQNRDAASRHGIPALRSFAYPFGAINSRARRVVAGEYATARTAWPGVNRGRFDAAALRAVPLMQRDGSAIANRHLRQLLDRDGWLVFYTHDVAEQPSRYGCHPSLLQEVCALALARGAEILPVSSVDAPVSTDLRGSEQLR